MFEEVKMEHAMRILNSRAFGFGNIRLLPKKNGVRPIANLKRRSVTKGSKNQLGKSINSVLAPVHNMLNYEKVSSRSGFVVSADTLRESIPSDLDQACSQSEGCTND